MGGVSSGEIVVVAVALGGVLGWAVSGVPLVATGCVIAADLVGAALMVPKTYRDPRSETLATFVLAALSGLLAAVAVGTPAVALLLYPAYFFVANGAIAALIVHRRHVLARLEPAALKRLAV